MPQRHVMLVTHSSLLLHTLGAATMAPDARVTSCLDIHASLVPKFDNAEMRSALVHRSPLADAESETDAVGTAAAAVAVPAKG